MQLRRKACTGAVLGLLSPILVLAADGPAARADDAGPGVTGGPYEATVTRTEHGIPHIVADDWGSLGFGSGYATAETSICTLADTVITGRGQRSLFYGEGTYDDQVQLQASNLQVDALATDLRNRKVVETLLKDPVRGPSDRAKELIRGYTAGVNEWVDEHGDGAEISDPECRGNAFFEEEATPLDVWYGVYFANLLASTGVFTKEIVDASPASLSDPGLPEVPGLPKLPTLKGMSEDELADVAAKVDKEKLLRSLGKDPDAGFGSNATAVGGDASTTGKGMLLGNPHFPWRGRYRFTQQHLTIPGEYDVAGASLIGSPVVNIGFNQDVAWSHTVSTAYRFTPYEYVTVPGSTTYVTGKGPKKLDHRQVEVEVRKDSGKVVTVEEDLYRTEVGYVVDAPDKLMPWGLATLWSIRDANAEHLRTIDSFLAMGGATDVRDLLRRQDKWGGVPWVNTIAADRDGNALYADHSVTPNVRNNQLLGCLSPVGHLLYLVAGLPGLNGALEPSLCGWKTDPDSARPGIIGPEAMPEVVRRDFVVNANDSYWLPNPDVRLEGYPKIMGCEKCERSLRTRMVTAYPAEATADGGKISPAELASFQYQNRVYGAEVMRADGALDTVCRAASGGAACDVLREWDGHSDRDSVGTALFEMFVQRLPAKGIWKVPFDVNDPLNTPRALDASNPKVVEAMEKALAYLDQQGVPVDQPWGELQVAGDRGAPPIGLGGGSAAAGNANALASRTPRQNDSYLVPVTYGSSHIQSIAFLPGGGVSARTILTYGQSEDPTSPWSSDQTRMFGNEQWVRFPWTDEEIAAQQVSREVVTGP